MIFTLFSKKNKNTRELEMKNLIEFKELDELDEFNELDESEKKNNLDNKNNLNKAYLQLKDAINFFT